MQDLTIVKIGGNVVDSPVELLQFLRDFAALPGFKLLVHGGGKIATTMGQRLGIEPNMVDGRRITDTETLELVTMVYGGLVNKNIVAQLQALSSNAIGLTGADANCIRATKRPVKTIDYGFVGDVAGAEAINTTTLSALFQAGLVPVLAPLTHDGQGIMLNTNADTIASVLAVAFASLYRVKLLYCFEKKGVLLNPEDDDSVVRHLNPAKFEEMRMTGQVSKGMLPKLDNAFHALQQGVYQVVIGQSHYLQEMASDAQEGTLLSLQAS
ncbi:acetylglutamate kinase [Pontibacter sp. SGAir0037]|uniref:acetylglutamate kinase n=1 Tax=Pontibacter sp. SGAir0037 TaxID=2571030 RepID=UPI0010CD62DF|nr:acetylglutamate kinase [Pontibacter sp. SGAir0037]QCR21969.1 acetylglutamate kinase [Pontibacter sp. SGAir0037]